jgi:hypothetical protein
MFVRPEEVDAALRSRSRLAAWSGPPTHLSGSGIAGIGSSCSSHVVAASATGSRPAVTRASTVGRPSCCSEACSVAKVLPACSRRTTTVAGPALGAAAYTAGTATGCGCCVRSADPIAAPTIVASR